MMDDKRLYAIVLQLAAMRPGALSANHGSQARGALLHLIRQGDSPLAQQLHDSNSAKPYAIEFVRGGKPGRNGAQHFGEGDRAIWRFSLMRQATFEALLQNYLLSHRLPNVRIGAIRFAITDAFVSPQAHPDSGHTSLQELMDRWNRPPDMLPDRVTLNFQSPATFSMGQNKETGEYRYRTTPDARTVFSNLRKRWTRMGGLDAGDAFDDWVAACIETQIQNLQHCQTTIKSRTIPGFTGRVTYQHYGEDTQWLAYLHMLADLTFWTGCGYQTTCGLGRVRRYMTG